MIHYIFGEKKNIYKANLHSHTTISDGHLTPLEMKNAYKEKGYSVLCFSEHEIMVPHPELDDDNFLAITGYEMSVDQPNVNFDDAKTMHMNLYSPIQNNKKQIQYHENDTTWLRRKGKDFSSVEYFGEQKEKKYGSETFNSIIAEANSHGYLVTMNHPAWSLQDQSDYENLNGLFGVEVFNTGCYVDGYFDCNPQPIDFLLKQGKKVYFTATDDNHNGRKFDDPRCDSFGGYDMINADDLGYDTIFNALKEGNFYASTGATINEITFDDEEMIVKVKCEPAKHIFLITGRRTNNAVIAKKGETVTYAEFKVKKEDHYFRIEVEDENGTAYSQAYMF